MATYDELHSLLDLSESSGLRKRVIVATLVAADDIRLEPDDPNSATVQGRKRFAQMVFKQQFSSNLFFRPDDSALALNSIFEAVYRLVIVANKSVPLANIQSATDVQIQNNVNDAVTHLATAYPDPVTP